MSETGRHEQIGREIYSLINKAVIEYIDELLEPILMFKKFESVDVLIFEEVCEVLRLTEDQLELAIRNNSITCLKIGKLRSTWRFPKRVLIDILLGDSIPR